MTILILSFSLVFAFILNNICSRFRIPVPVSIGSGFFILIFKNMFEIDLSAWFYLLPAFGISMLFTSFPLSYEGKFTAINHTDRKFLAYSLLQFFVQWTLGLAVTLLLIQNFSLSISPLFAAVLPAGFAGGHSTAAMMGGLIQTAEDFYIRDLMMFSATCGVIIAIVTGLALGYKKGGRQVFNYPLQEMRYIQIKDLFLIMFFSSIGYFLNQFIFHIFKVNIPFFIYSLILCLLSLPWIKRKPISKRSIGGISNLSTGLIVLSGIGAISFVYIEKYISILAILFGLIITISYLFYRFIGLRSLNENARLKSLFTWGWSLGGLGIGYTLIYMIDKDKAQTVFNDYAKIYPAIAPVEVSLIFLAPTLLNSIDIKMLLLIFMFITASLILYLRFYQKKVI